MRELAGDAFVIAGAVVGRLDVGSGTVVVDDDALTLILDAARSDDERWRVRVDGIVAVQWVEDTVTLVLHDDSRLALRGPEGLALHGRLLTACRALPEFTRALRAMGSRRSGAQDREGGPAEETAFFAPLLEARRRATAALSPEAIIAAFDSLALSATLSALIEQLAATRAGDRAPLRRAIEAELGDEAQPLYESLEILGAAAVVAAARVEDLNHWRRWATALRSTFETADRVWVVLNRTLGSYDIRPPASRPAARSKKALLIVAGALSLGTMSSSAAHAQHRMLRVVGVPIDSLRARGFDVVDRRGSDGVIVANQYDEAKLRARGWNTIDIQPSAAARSVAAAPTVYRSFDDPVRGIAFFLDSLARANPKVHLDTIGTTYEGRPLLMVKIGPADDSPSRPNVLLMGTYHAREWAATETALRLMVYLATATDARTDSLTKNRDIWVLPVANPDGYQYTFTTDRLWRKNRDPVGVDATGATIYGVDLNRNHSAFWDFDDDGSSGDPTNETYRGPHAASEAEVAAIEAFHVKHPPIAAISYHTYAGLLLFPPGHSSGDLAADFGIFRTLGGTDERPGAPDRLPGSTRTVYHNAPGWDLYPTNGEYTDYAYANFGTIAFTPELTSGMGLEGYYGFVFPDDETQLNQLFQDQLPFALDVIESASDPVKYVSPTTGFATEPVVVESVSPLIRLRAPVGADVTVTGAAPIAMKSTTPIGKYFRRLVSDSISRPPTVSVSALSQHWQFTLLAAGGAEAGDGAWKTSGFATVVTAAAGKLAWYGTAAGYIRSPLVPVPSTVDTVSVLYWTMYDGNGTAPTPHGEVRLSLDNGVTFNRVGSVTGAAPVYYPERVVIGGVAGKTIQVEFTSPDSLHWWIDEVTLLAHSVSPLTVASATELRPNANPVHSDVVLFNWPFGSAAGEMRAYDFSGRLVWRKAVTGSTITVPWDLRSPPQPNGVYLVVAQSDKNRKTFKLFVTRPRQ